MSWVIAIATCYFVWVFIKAIKTKRVSELKELDEQYNHDIKLQKKELDLFRQNHTKFILMRNQIKEFERLKEWNSIIIVCEQIYRLDAEYKKLGIVLFMFYKKQGTAYLKLNNYAEALACIEKAKQACLDYRKYKKLSNPDDFLDEISILDKKIISIQKKISAI